MGVLDKVREGVCVFVFDGLIVVFLIIYGFCEVGRVSEAYNVLEELRNRGCKFDFIVYRIVVEVFRSNGLGCIFEV